MTSSESLRGYGRDIFKRDGWKCAYCGLDCSQFELWLFLCVDHIIPKQQKNDIAGDVEDYDNQITACRMCNEFANRTKFDIPKRTTFKEQIASVFDQKKKEVLKRREIRYDFWLENVKPFIKTEKH